MAIKSVFNDIFLGVATDTPRSGKRPEQPICAVNDIVYYYEPGSNRGQTATVLGYWREDNGRIKVKVKITATGEEIDVYQNRIRQ